MQPSILISLLQYKILNNTRNGNVQVNELNMDDMKLGLYKLIYFYNVVLHIAEKVLIATIYSSNNVILTQPKDHSFDQTLHYIFQKQKTFTRGDSLGKEKVKETESKPNLNFTRESRTSVKNGTQLKINKRVMMWQKLQRFFNIT